MIRSDAMVTLDLLHGYTEQVNTNTKELENPQAVHEYINFFADVVTRAAHDCQEIAAELTTEGIKREQIALLRQWAQQASAEQRRCLLFRDKIINKPLPYERMRPLLNDISVTTRDQLTAFRDLGVLADRLAALQPAPPPAAPPDDDRRYDRRALFTRFFKKPGS